LRYIGNKTRLLGFIRRVLLRRGVRQGTALDPFSGTASVARALKRWGFAVTASDVMEYAYVFARAYVEVPTQPTPDELPPIGDNRPADLRAICNLLNRLEPRPGFVHAHFAPDESDGRPKGRMYFTPANAARIDTIRRQLHLWRTAGSISRDAHDLLLAALIEAADRVANTTGVYAAYVKSWQPNAVRTLRLEPPGIINGNGCRAVRTDAIELVAAHDEVDLLYLDPPYNTRQYPGYYHIPELIATGWFDRVPKLRGKTGLLPDAEKRSVWCSLRKAESAFEELLASARCRHIMLSYNAEGIIPETSIERIMKSYGLRSTYRRYRHTYRRYRADSDRDGRRYAADKVSEYLYCISR